MRAVVTGAGSGIGRAVARRLAEDSRRAGGTAELLLVDVVAEGMETIAAELEEAGHSVWSAQVDLGSPEAGEVVAARAREEMSGVDALVSNAGIVRSASLLELDVETWEQTVAVNLRATWLLAKGLHPLLAESEGAIVATSSIASFAPAPLMGAYCASKAGLAMLIRQMAYEWGADGIRCNCVSPGTTLTGMTKQSYSDPEVRAERGSRLPVGRLAEPEELAAVVSFFAGPDSSYVTGTNLLVDGGFLTTLIPGLRGLDPP